MALYEIIARGEYGYFAYSLTASDEDDCWEFAAKITLPGAWPNVRGWVKADTVADARMRLKGRLDALPVPLTARAARVAYKLDERRRWMWGSGAAQFKRGPQPDTVEYKPIDEHVPQVNVAYITMVIILQKIRAK